ncbi:FHA domain-containing protein [Arthrobacter sp. I2-34]|uniref:FHA domain-containing protein n=1 Tax=Arthrobacter hankyongi TaxID=2904801 RepID=A0ABS9L7S3_9MICC|nr:FtsK/SpoIIIE domain-containing protein [Arthrobacter hankyongi]MCG2622720.1 FHA domain-containing protein [Arthrobacter hankyongi]
MLLHLSLAAAPGLPAAAAAWVGKHSELVVDAGRCGTVDLADWLRARLAGAVRGEPDTHRLPGRPVPLAVHGVPLEALEPGTAPLLDGAVIVCGTASPGTPAARGTPLRPLLALAANGGPDAGRILELRRGRQVLGRGPDGSGVADPRLSRRHAVLEVTGHAVVLRDNGSANGIRVDGRRVRQAVLDTGTTVLAGSSRFRLLAGNEPLPAWLPEADLARPVDLRSRPPDARARLALLLAGLPLLAGLALAAATGMWLFLAFGAGSLAAAVIPYAAGRKQRRAYRRAVAEAAAADGERRRGAGPDPATILSGLLEPAAPPASDPGRPPQHLWLRLGTADQAANIGLPAGGPEPPVIPQAPVLVDLLAIRELVVHGNLHELDGMLRCCLLQLGRRAMDSALRVVCCGDAGHVPASARFIPGVELAGTVPEPDAGVATVLLLTGRTAGIPLPVDAGVATAVIRFAAPDRPAPAPPPRHAVPRPVPAEAASGPAGTGAPVLLTMDPESATLVRGPQRLTFAADLVGADTMDRFARLAAAGGRRRPHFPARYPPGPRLAGGNVTGSWQQNRDSRGLAVAIGSTSDGPLTLDLARDGPHLLVAGTTGSGKSELLRSLVLGLAAAYRPQQAAFLLVDFKGGAGLGALAQLPHTAGLLTDLSVENVGRALRWLRAEVRRREALLAGLAARDIAGCAAGTLPRLVVVVDEFRILVDEVPDALGDLMRIATLGRSLGIHLVLATQRPQGAVSPDIRANINASIALRVLSRPESADVVGTDAAASISAGTPGRAYLRLAGGPPVLFQAAMVDGPAPSGPAVQTLSQWLGGPATGSGRPADSVEPVPAPDQTAELVAQIGRAAAALGLAGTGPVLPPPLPPVLQPGPAVPGAASPGVGLGLLDLPEEQRQVQLRWLPERDGHLGLVGAEASGARDVLQCLGLALLAEETERHCYLLDGDGSLAGLGGCGRTGAYVGPRETARGARLLRRLAREAADRLGTAAPGSRVPLVLLVNGWGRWLSAFRNGRLDWAEDCLQDIARDGGSTGISLAVSGDRELHSSRFFALVPNRCFLPAGSPPEALLAWPRLPPLDPVPGRALVQGPISGGRDAAAQLATTPAQVPAPVAPAQRPFRVEDLPMLLPAAALPAAAPARKPGPGGVQTAPVVGVEGDELQPSALPLRAGCVHLVLGGPGSGKSNLLDLLAEQLQGSWQLCRPGPDCPPDRYWELLPGCGPGTLLLVDDAHLLGAGTHRTLATLAAGGASIVLTAVPAAPLPQLGPLAAQARSAGWGMVLAPRSPEDGAFFGVRLDADWAPPGRGYRIGHGRTVTMQVALCSRSGNAAGKAKAPADPSP